MFSKLRKNFVLLNMVIISAMMFVTLGVIYIFMYSNITLSNQNKLSNIPVGVATLIRELPDSSNEIFSGGLLPTNYSLSFNLVLNREWRLLKINSYVDMPLETYEMAATKIVDSKKEYGTMKLDGRSWMYQIRKSGLTNFRSNVSGAAYYAVFLDVTDSRESLNSLLIMLITVGSLMLFVIYLISIYFARRSVSGIEDAWNKQKQFIADASHEFKTPIAVIEANTDALLLSEKKKNKKWIDYIRIETSRMNKLVTDLLYLAKTENLDTPFENSPFVISDVLSKVILTMEAFVFEKNIKLVQNIEAGLIFNGDASRIEQVMVILLDNAVKYTNNDGLININLKKNNKLIEFSIENTGKGIDSSHLSKIFDRFYRVDSARNGSDNSYGLGLPIAASIVERMNGKIIAESIPDETTKFTVIFKIK